MTSKIEGRRERFQKWVLATKHPVLGFLDGHWLARGDDREGYASEYVQGLWVAFKELAAPEAPRQDAIGTLKRIGQNIIFDVIGDPHIRDGMEVFTAPLSPDHSGGGAGMVLPEKFPLYDDMDFFDKGWNAAIERVKELNQ